MGECKSHIRTSLFEVGRISDSPERRARSEIELWNIAVDSPYAVALFRIILVPL